MSILYIQNDALEFHYSFCKHEQHVKGFLCSLLTSTQQQSSVCSLPLALGALSSQSAPGN